MLYGKEDMGCGSAVRIVSWFRAAAVISDIAEGQELCRGEVDIDSIREL